MLLTWPLAGQLGSQLPFDAGFVSQRGADTHIWVWDFWWVEDALSRGHSPFYSDLIFPPRGASLGLHTHVILYAALAAPLTAWFGAVFAVGLALLVLFATAFAATWALARELGSTRPAAAIAAFAWAFAPYFLHKGLEHMNLMAAPWPPLLCLFLLRWMRGGGVRAAVGSGVIVGLTALVGPLVFVMTGIFGLFVCLLRPKEGTQRLRLLRPWPLFLGVSVAVLIALPALAEMRSEWLASERFTERTGNLSSLGFPGTEEANFVSRDVLARPRLVDFVRLPDLHPLAGSDSRGVHEEVPGGNEIAALHISSVLWVLALLALVRAPRRERRSLLFPLAGLALWFLVLTWDPVLGLGLGHPSELYRRLPLLEGLRVPARFLPYGLLPLALLAARGADLLLQLSNRVAGRAALGLLVVLLGFESWTRPYPLMDLTPPTVVETLAGEPAPADAEFVLTLPAYMGASEAMTWQSQHRRGVVLSYLARVSPWVTRALELTTPDLYLVLVPQMDAAGNLRVPDPMGLAVDLSHAGVGVVLVDPEAFAAAGAVLDLLAELLDDMPGWQREGSNGELLAWRLLL